MVRKRTLRAIEWCISVVTYSELCFSPSLRPEATKLIRLVEGFLDIAMTLAAHPPSPLFDIRLLEH
jgi:hypothetical protein